MKKMIAIVLIVLLLPVSVLIYGASLPEYYGDTYYAQLPEMYEKLKNAQEKKIVIVGGSNIAFGVDSAQMEQILRDCGYDYTVCNFGLYAAVGTSVMLELSDGYLNDGDIVILAVEPTSETFSTYFGATAFWKCAEKHPQMLLELGESKRSAMLGNYISYLQDRTQILHSGILPSAEGVYAKASFDESCNMVYCTVWSFLVAEVMGQFVMPFLAYVRTGNPLADVLCKAATVLVIGIAASALLRRTLVRQLQHDGDYLVNGRKTVFSLLLILLHMVLTNYQVIFWLIGNSDMESANMVVTFRVVIGLFAMVILFLQNDIEKRQKAQQELEIVRQMWHQQQEQFKLSKENIDIINRKCHDLKHQMAALRELKDQDEIERQVAKMESAVMIYDSAIRTGNPVLDVALTEKSLYCEAHQINMTCLVDGKLLEFIDRIDLYTLFGNALDNAIESVMQQTDKQKRVIQVAAYEEQGMLLIRVRNFCDRPPLIVDGMPVTTKADTAYHGFGLKSIRYTAEKYGGGISIQTGNNVFSLQILIPLPGEEPA